MTPSLVGHSRTKLSTKQYSERKVFCSFLAMTISCAFHSNLCVKSVFVISAFSFVFARAEKTPSISKQKQLFLSLTTYQSYLDTLTDSLLY